jgi:hypothetical protein
LPILTRGTGDFKGNAKKTPALLLRRETLNAGAWNPFTTQFTKNLSDDSREMAEKGPHAGGGWKRTQGPENAQ